MIGKTVDAYTTLRAALEAGNYGPPGSELRRTVEATPMVFRPVAAQPFDARCLSWQFGDLGRDGTVSIWTVAGRLRTVRVVGNPHHLLLLLRGRTIGETDLIHRDGPWLLHATIDAPQTPAREPNGFLGVDLGTGRHRHHQRRCSGSHLTRYRTRQQRIRTRLQAKRASSARRLLKKRRRKEARFAAEVSHQISKNIVAEAERTGRGIAA